MRLGVLDVVSIASSRRSCLVLPTLDHAAAMWKMYRTAFSEQHGSEWVTHTKTAIALKRTHTYLRLWVPYEQSIEMPFATLGERNGILIISPWYSKIECDRWGEAYY